MSDASVTLIAAILGSGALSAAISGIFTIITNRSKKKDGIRDGLKCLMYDRVNFLGNKHIENGFISEEDRHILIDMWKVYHDGLGGNGYLDDLMNRVKALPNTIPNNKKEKGGAK